jgi:hypothetical protein
MKRVFSSVIETVTGSKYPFEQNGIDETFNCIFDLTRTPFRSKEKMRRAGRMTNDLRAARSCVQLRARIKSGVAIADPPHRIN